MVTFRKTSKIKDGRTNMKFLSTIHLLAAAVCVYSTGCATKNTESAPQTLLNVTLWRGETMSVRMPDKAAKYCKDIKADNGICVKFGAIKPVKYLTHANGTTFEEALDLVKWGAEDSGYRMAEIYVPAEVKAGTYSCGPIGIEVVNRILPPAKEWKYYLDLWQHPWAVSRINGLEPFSAEHYASMKPLWEQLAAAGQKTLTVPLLELPWNHQCYDAYHSMIKRTKNDDGSWEFDYSLFDEYVTFGRKCGIGKHIACYSMCPWGNIIRYFNSKDGMVAVEAPPGSKQFADFWGPFLADFKRHLVEKGWFEDTYIAMDERSPEDLKKIREFIDSNAAGFKISMAGNMSAEKFASIKMENYCQYICYLDDKFLETARQRSTAGNSITTYYVCCGPNRPNTFLGSNIDESFWLGAYPAFAGLNGFLRWAYNSWPQDPAKDASFGNWRPGDTFLVYPDGSPSLRFLELKNGIIAAEKVWLLEKSGELDTEAFNKARNYFKEKKDFHAAKDAVQKIVNQNPSK